MSQGQKKLPPLVVHALVTFVLCLVLFPVLPVAYLAIIAIYYAGRGGKSLLQRIPRPRWPRASVMCRFGCAFVLASAMGGILAGMVFGDKLHSKENRDYVGGFGAMSLLIFMPLWLFVFSLPRRIRARGEANKTAESARERSRIANDNDRDRQRRKAARARCELLFNLYKVDIASRFDRGMLDAFLKEYMNDGDPPDVVERNAEELCGILKKHREAEKGTSKPTTIDQLATWFLDEKKRIESLPLDEELKEEHLAHLNIRYSELSQEILEKMNP